MNCRSVTVFRICKTFRNTCNVNWWTDVQKTTVQCSPWHRLATSWWHWHRMYNTHDTRITQQQATASHTRNKPTRESWNYRNLRCLPRCDRAFYILCHIHRARCSHIYIISDVVILGKWNPSGSSIPLTMLSTQFHTAEAFPTNNHTYIYTP